MSEANAKRKGELMRGVFEILSDHPDGLQAREVLERVAKLVPPTPFEASDYPNHPGVRRYEKIVRFVTIGPVKAGWLAKRKGTWTITEEGRKAFKELSDPEELAKEASRKYRQWKRDRDADAPSESEEETDEDVDAAATLEEAEESAWAEIESYLASLNPYDFQELVAALIRAMGYHVNWVAPPGPDRGIDIIAASDPLGIEGPRIKVQVKRRADRVPVGEIRSFLALLSDGDVGLFVASGGFTKDAEDEARYQERRRIMLVDLKRLFDLWVDHYAQIPEHARRLLSLRPVYFLEPEQ